MLESEMNEHLGYGKYERSEKPSYRNGTRPKSVRSKYGEFETDVPQDRQSTFDPAIIPKRKKDISGIEDKIISMYAKGMTTTQISEMVEDIYGFEISGGMVSDITDKLLLKIEEWQNRQRSVFPSSQALLKSLYLATFEATKNGRCRCKTGERQGENCPSCFLTDWQIKPLSNPTLTEYVIGIIVKEDGKPVWSSVL